MDDIKRPPKQYLNSVPGKPLVGDDPQPSKPQADNNNSASDNTQMTHTESQTYNSSPVSLEDLDKDLNSMMAGGNTDAKSNADTKSDLMPDMKHDAKPEVGPVDLSSQSAESKDKEPASSATAVDTSPHVYDPTSKDEDKPAMPDMKADTKPDAEPAEVATGLSSEPVAKTPEMEKPEMPKAPEVESEPLSNDHIPIAPDLSEDKPTQHRPDLVDGKLETKAGSIPVSELPPAPELSEHKKGKVSKASTDHPKKKFNWLAILVAFVLALALAGGAGYAYLQNSKEDSNKPATTETTQQDTTETKSVTGDDLNKTNAEIDQTLKEIEATDEALNGDLTDSGLGI